MRVSRARRPEVEFVVDGCVCSKRFEREEREGVVFVLAIGSCGRRKGEKSCLGFIIID